MGATTKGFPYPANSDPVNVPNDLSALASAIDTYLDNYFLKASHMGRNYCLNADFLINQRNFTSNTTTGTYNFDRWLQQNVGGSFTVTPQNFTPGAAPIAGVEGRTYVQGITAAQAAVTDYATISQRIEDVTRLAGRTIAVSFYAKANTGTPKIGVELQQNFGSGGAPSAAVSVPMGTITLSTSWARYTVTVAVPSISGKTLGTTANTSYLELNLFTSAGSNFTARAGAIGIQNFTASIWGVQVELGTTASIFNTATGNVATELLACQRYYYRHTSTQNPSWTAVGFCNATNSVMVTFAMPVVMRAKPTLETTGVAADYNVNHSGGTTACNSVPALTSSTEPRFLGIQYAVAAAPFTAGYAATVGVGGANVYLGFPAEL
jgi:hypothetical protein